jgi:hypothetical protein
MATLSQSAAETQTQEDARHAANLQTQAQAAADAEAARTLQMLDVAGQLLAPRSYGGVRRHTTCQQIGFQLVCN